MKKLIIRDKNDSKVLYERRGDRGLGKDEGGLYGRVPKWFATDDHKMVRETWEENGDMVLDIGKTPDKIVHWWTNRIPYKRGHNYELEAIVRVEGDIGLQIGADYWDGYDSAYSGYEKNCSGVNNCEVFVSKWLCDSNGKYLKISIPLEQED